MGRADGKPNKPNVGSARYIFAQRFGKDIMEYASFQRSIAGLAKSTIADMRKRLCYFCLYIGEDPDQIIAQRQKDIMSYDATVTENYERKVKEYARYLLDEKKQAGYTVNTAIGNIQSFFSHNGRRMSLELDTRRLKIPKVAKVEKHTVTNEEVRKLMYVADCARDKFIVAAAYHHGLAPADIAALKIGKYPLDPWVCFRLAREKTGEEIRVVSTPDTVDALKAYSVIRGGAPGDSLLMGRQGPLRDGGDVSEILQGLIKKAGFGGVEGFKPYSLRDAFEDALGDAEIYHKVKETLMGRTSDIEHRYGGRKKADAKCVEAMQKTFPLLCLNDANKDVAATGISREDMEILQQTIRWAKTGKLVHVNDPEFFAKVKQQILDELRKEGKVL